MIDLKPEPKPFDVDEYIKNKKINEQYDHYVYPNGNVSDFTKGDSCYSVYDQARERNR